MPTWETFEDVEWGLQAIYASNRVGRFGQLIQDRKMTRANLTPALLREMWAEVQNGVDAPAVNGQAEPPRPCGSCGQGPTRGPSFRNCIHLGEARLRKKGSTRARECVCEKCDAWKRFVVYGCNLHGNTDAMKCDTCRQYNFGYAEKGVA